MIFSLPAFLIALRETMEAALIVSIILGYLVKTNNLQYRKDVWIGVGLAVFASIGSAFLFDYLLGGFEGETEKYFEGVAYITTSMLISWMIIYMMKQGKYIASELHSNMDQAFEKTNRYSLIVLVFVNVLREGIETVLFFTGIGIESDPFSVFVSGLIGIAVTLILAMLLFRGTLQLNIKQFFNVTGLLLILFAAGLFSHGLHEFQEVNVFGPPDAFVNVIVYDISHILNDKENTLGVLLRALFGYQDKGTWLEIGSYVLYWLFIVIMYMKINTKKSQ
ncbi:MAG: FTR1 family protein [Candidatus Heimdallarchaeota archaeon]|nr:FTR1 family protein [Candidatus Heimdallarchaeota archaeon]